MSEMYVRGMMALALNEASVQVIQRASMVREKGVQGMDVVCSYCDAEFQIEAGTDPVICPKCHCTVPGGTSDWRLVYYEEVNKPLPKGGGRGEKADRTHSWQRQLRRKIARANLEFRNRVDPWEFRRR